MGVRPTVVAIRSAVIGVRTVVAVGPIIAIRGIAIAVAVAVWMDPPPIANLLNHTGVSFNAVGCGAPDCSRSRVWRGEDESGDGCASRNSRS